MTGLVLSILREPWPWYVGGPLIGFMVPALLWLGNHRFGMSPALRHVCAATVPGKLSFFRYDWKQAGLWNLTLTLGVVLGGFIATRPFFWTDIAMSPATQASLAALGTRPVKS